MQLRTTLAAFALLAVAASARADDKVIHVKTQVIHGRAARPMVVTEVARIPIGSSLRALRKPLTPGIAAVVARAPV